MDAAVTYASCTMIGRFVPIMPYWVWLPSAVSWLSLFWASRNHSRHALTSDQMRDDKHVVELNKLVMLMHKAALSKVCH